MHLLRVGIAGRVDAEEDGLTCNRNNEIQQQPLVAYSLGYLLRSAQLSLCSWITKPSSPVSRLQYLGQMVWQVQMQNAKNEECGTDLEMLLPSFHLILGPSFSTLAAGGDGISSIFRFVCVDVS